MIYTVGDTHADQDKWLRLIEPVLHEGDTVIVAGDFGVGFWDGKYRTEEMFYDYLGQREFTVLFIDGNHENFDKLNAYPVENRFGGRVHIIRKNVFHLIRGEIYLIEGHSVFVMGGGYSMDKYRRQEGVSWWPQEMPCEEEYRRAEENLEKAGNRVDYVITHTAPSETVYYLSKMRSFGIEGVTQELPLTAFLEDIRERVTYRHWYFGHFHIDAELWRNQTALLDSVRELTTGTVVREWQPDGN